MFNIGQLRPENSFTLVGPDITLIQIKNKLLEYDYVVVSGNNYYTIANSEYSFIALAEDSLPVIEWVDKVNWLPSTVSTSFELSTSKIDWRRPVLIQNHDKEEIFGVLTAHQWIQYLDGENKKVSAYFNTLAETINDAVTAVDQEGTVICWNSVAEGTYKIKRENILGQKIGEHFNAESLILHHILNEGRTVRGAYHRPNHDTHVLINASPIIKENIIIGGIAIERDITGFVRLNEELDSSVPSLIHQDNPFDSIIGVSPEIQQALQIAQKVASAEIPVLLTGEPGSGKEMLAQAIHYGGSRNTGPFVSVNCSTIPSGLLEAELFGYQEGVFTSDRKTWQAGKIEQACNGTLFLEEIDKMPLDIQEKFLNYLEQQSFYRVGGTELITTKIRVIASTSQPLEAMAKAGEFNEALYYRLTVITIDIPPLRNRKEDIMKLVLQFVQEFSSKYKKPIPEINPKVMTILMNYDWPGNVRELRNVVERFIILNDENIITLNHLPKNIMNTFSESNSNVPGKREATLKELAPIKDEASMIEEALRKTYGNKSAAAKLLGISRGTLYNKIKEYGLN
ncbi:sigma-54-dependent Fis family transcriptional regulator [Bacillus sp. MUM 116]|uniref:sigma-54 interaction domain-containing protein n=1 Tax=Bacillus sp. MUM 116 TaxID=1678002 RepID=UPI0008F56EAF|nr:sigma 54-interacting transcriptional regulator [Bacillus sp. MUM 116]OIK15827.1 sigma-54-dependent Fis family transcriptional regulator [Bacillus sp. MUM 116]